jgi:CBS domain-containing protein
MKVKEAMTNEVVVARPDQTIAEAARMMAECDSGVLPVGEDDRLVGMLTDRDIAIRAVAKDLPCDTPIRDVMSKEVLYCYEDEDVEKVADNMGEQQIRRLPVLDREKRLVGIVSLGDLAGNAKPKTSGQAIAAISRPGGRHDQTLH